MFSLIREAQSWGILIAISEIILLFLGMILIISGSSQKAFNRFFLLCHLPLLFGIIGYFQISAQDIIILANNESNRDTAWSPLLLGLYSLAAPTIIFIYGRLTKSSLNDNTGF